VHDEVARYWPVASYWDHGFMKDEVTHGIGGSVAKGGDADLSGCVAKDGAQRDERRELYSQPEQRLIYEFLQHSIRPEFPSKVSPRGRYQG
jgi:hypothetical protein